MHSTGAPCLRIQSAFKHGSKDGWRDVAPIKILACMVQEQVPDFIGDGRDLNIFIGKQTAIHVRKCRKIFIHVRITFVFRLIKDPEQVDQRIPHVLRLVRIQIVMEHGMTAEQTRILGIQAEDKTHTESVQALLGLLVRRVFILLVESIIELAYDLAGLHGYLHLFRQGGMFFFHKELHAVCSILQGFQLNDFRILSRLILVMDLELLKIAGHDIPRHLIQRHIVSVSLGLLVWSE